MKLFLFERAPHFIEFLIYNNHLILKFLIDVQLNYIPSFMRHEYALVAPIS